MKKIKQILDDVDKIIDSYSQSCDFDADYDGNCRKELKDFTSKSIEEALMSVVPEERNDYSDTLSKTCTISTCRERDKVIRITNIYRQQLLNKIKEIYSK